MGCFLLRRHHGVFYTSTTTHVCHLTLPATASWCFFTSTTTHVCHLTLPATASWCFFTSTTTHVCHLTLPAMASWCFLPALPHMCVISHMASWQGFFYQHYHMCVISHYRPWHHGVFYQHYHTCLSSHTTGHGIMVFFTSTTTHVCHLTLPAMASWCFFTSTTTRVSSHTTGHGIMVFFTSTTTRVSSHTANHEPAIRVLNKLLTYLSQLVRKAHYRHSVQTHTHTPSLYRILQRLLKNLFQLVQSENLTEVSLCSMLGFILA